MIGGGEKKIKNVYVGDVEEEVESEVDGKIMKGGI